MHYIVLLVVLSLGAIAYAKDPTPMGIPVHCDEPWESSQKKPNGYFCGTAPIDDSARKKFCSKCRAKLADHKIVYYKPTIIGAQPPGGLGYHYFRR